MILKNSEYRARGSDGRDQASLSWEAKFPTKEGRNENDEREAGEAEKKTRAVWLPWENFKPTYRGRESPGKEELDKGNITTVGIMMRSYFGRQGGDFRLEVESITARKELLENDAGPDTKIVGGRDQDPVDS